MQGIHSLEIILHSCTEIVLLVTLDLPVYTIQLCPSLKKFETLIK